MSQKQQKTIKYEIEQTFATKVL